MMPMVLRGLAVIGLWWGLLVPTGFGAESILVVKGADGEEVYGAQFAAQIDQWTSTAEIADASITVIGMDPLSEPTDRDRLHQALTEFAQEPPGRLWLVLIGHGTFDGSTARFNLRGPDLSADDLAAWLSPIPGPLVVINTASASGPFLHALAGPDRIVITATRSGSELNVTRFGTYLAQSLADPESDFDRDGQTSLLEACLAASAGVRAFYQSESRLATEHALIDDNGDGKGTPAEWFRGVRARKRPDEDAAIDGALAHQVHLVLSPAEQQLPADIRGRRDHLEQKVFALRERKGEVPEEDYFVQLERLLLELARLYKSAEDSPREEAVGEQGDSP